MPLFAQPISAPDGANSLPEAGGAYARGPRPQSVTAVPLLANTGSLGSPAASPAFVLAQAFAAHGVRLAPYVRKQKLRGPARTAATVLPVRERGSLARRVGRHSRSCCWRSRVPSASALASRSTWAARRVAPPSPDVSGRASAPRAGRGARPAGSCTGSCRRGRRRGGYRLAVVRGTAGAWSVAVRSACAQSAAVSGALLLSASRALLIWASSRWSQNSDQFELPVEWGTNDWQA